VVTRCSRSV